jgi:hypothetical protein
MERAKSSNQGGLEETPKASIKKSKETNNKGFKITYIVNE